MFFSELFYSACNRGYRGMKKLEKIVDFFVIELGFRVEFQNGLFFVNETAED